MSLSNAVCPYCKKPLEIRLTAAPPMQAAASTDVSNLGQLLDSIDMDALKPNARQFVEDQRARFEKYGATTRMSDKQMQWLRELAEGDF